MLILGIDDAGRGPLIGSMFLAGVLIRKQIEEVYKDKGVDDSKKLPHSKRIELSKYIESTAKNFYVAESTPEQIDYSINSKINLNTLEAMKAAEIINKINDKKEKIRVIIDCPSINTSTWKKKLLEFIHHKDNLDIICEHKADANYSAVSAASILAKVARENSIAKLKSRLKIDDFGSGYPSDPITKDFLKNHGKSLSNSGIFRKTWATWKAVFPEKDSQARLF